jgi:endoribonuclease Dicer
MSYWVVPILSGASLFSLQSTSLEDFVDMQQMRKVYEQPTWQWTPDALNYELMNRYIVDPMNGGRRFYSGRIAHHLKPQDPVPAHIPRQNQKFMDSILDYSDSKWQKTRDIKRWHQDQPVLEAEKIPFRRNHLARVEDKEQEILRSLKTVICLEPMCISNVSVSRTSFFFKNTSC